MRLLRVLLNLSVGTLCLPMHAAEPEVRGTWLTTTANTAIATPENTAASMRQLRDIGLNTVYVECWKNGYTEFPSDTMQRAVGVPMKINPSTKDQPAVQRDLLQECVIEAHRNELLCIAWFEYGFMAAHKNTQNELRARRDWISLNKSGSDVANNGFAWLNPIQPEAQQLLIDIVVEAVRKYDLDGIQLDDRIVWPGLEMGYDPFTRAVYRNETGKDVPDDQKEPHWTSWRANKVTEFARRFVREVRSANPQLIISLSPGPYPWAYEHYLCDWVSWAGESPSWDEFVPQVYRMDYPRFKIDWDAQVKFMAEKNRQRDLIAGIRLVGDGPDLPTADIARSADAVRASGAAGHAWWFSRGVLEVFPEAISTYYDVQKNGQAPHPRKGAGWRPPAIRAELQPDGSWRADVSPGKWQVIARRDGQWKLQGEPINLNERRPITLQASDVQAVELLLDRR